MPGQQVRQPVRGLIQLAIGPRPAPANSTPPPPGRGPPARRTTPESTPRADAGWVNTARLPHSSSRACSPASSTSIDDSRRVGSAVIATNTRSQPLDQRLDAGRVEHIGVEFDAKAQFAARQGLHRQRVVVVFAGGELGDGQLVGRRTTRRCRSGSSRTRKGCRTAGRGR